MSSRARTFSPDLRRRLILFASAGVVAAAIIAAHGTARPAEAAAPPASDDLTVVELFTSQGCSSCPPANDNLWRLSTRPDVLTLSFSVTYWDDLGWPDTFARPAYTQRQRDYQHGLGTDNVWTPQMVVDGRNQIVGQRMSDIERLLVAHRPSTGPADRLPRRRRRPGRRDHADRARRRLAGPLRTPPDRRARGARREQRPDLASRLGRARSGPAGLMVRRPRARLRPARAQPGRPSDRRPGPGSERRADPGGGEGLN